jgi:hypothetical protein
VSDLPRYFFEPVYRAAGLALGRREGDPIVDIRCAVSYSRRSCSKPLGGAYVTPHGIVVTLNRLGRHDTVGYYQRIRRDRELRERVWEEQGFIDEIPVLLWTRDSSWRVVPGPDEEPTVCCPRDGSWALDLEAIEAKVAEARMTRRKLRYGTAPKVEGA